MLNFTQLKNKILLKELRLGTPLATKIVLGVIFLIGVSLALPTSEATPEPKPPEAQIAGQNNVDNSSTVQEIIETETIYYEVVSVTDGDTIKVLMNDEIETVRLVNMDSPETQDPRKSVECMGQEASKKMTELVSNKKVALEIDETQTDRDRYNRLLRYVFLEDGTDVGLEMIRLGFAESSPYGSSPHQYLDLYEQAQKQAQEQELGLWNPEACVTPTSQPTARPTLVPTPIPTRIPTPWPTNPPAQTTGSVQSTTTLQPGTETNPPPAQSIYQCDCSKTCPNMSSCEEACYQLNVCGCTKRDGDKDGVPCEIICPGG